MPKQTEIALRDELECLTVKAFLPKAKAQAIATGDTEWLERLNEIERKHAKR